ncbi:MAG: hypothetical protein EHM21_13215 [Chloroflexi bacterium]|nr:MAG: hypothetical protein EHM21_13215 [Chloroflexota bacterium]
MHFLRVRSLLILLLGTLLVAAGLGYALSRPQHWDTYPRECEHPDHTAEDHVIARSGASGREVYGPFGANSSAPWTAEEDSVMYTGIDTLELKELYLKLRYSKNSPVAVPILIYLDYEPDPRAILYLPDQHDWDAFTWTEPVQLGPVSRGRHFLRLTTEGQPNGVAELDQLILTTTRQ